MKEFKLIIAGSRGFNDKELMRNWLYKAAQEAEDGVEISLISGMAPGADRLAWEIAQEEGIECLEMPADWGRHGKSAGYFRNTEMARVADGLMAFWDGKSPGTQHMIRTMQGMDKPVCLIMYEAKRNVVLRHQPAPFKEDAQQASQEGPGATQEGQEGQGEPEALSEAPRPSNEISQIGQEAGTGQKPEDEDIPPWEGEDVLKAREILASL